MSRRNRADLDSTSRFGGGWPPLKGHTPHTQGGNISFDLSEADCNLLTTAWKKIFGKQRCHITVTDIFPSAESPEIRINDKIACWLFQGKWIIAVFRHNPFFYHGYEYYTYAKKETWAETVTCICCLNVEFKLMNVTHSDPPQELHAFLAPIHITPPLVTTTCYQFQLTLPRTNTSYEDICDTLDNHGLSIINSNLSPTNIIIGVAIEADKPNSAQSYILQVLRTVGLEGNLQLCTNPA